MNEKKNYTIHYYSDDIADEIRAWPRSISSRFFRLADRMEIFGGNLGGQHTKAFGNGLFELRIKGAEGIGRVFYCTVIGKNIFMLHSFIKKTQKTPQKELEIAISRMREVKNGR
ncbi:MAG: type II toxin-antitoxin system RelE/ParE family toxin [Oxalobacter formigenes]|nr:type II toxin-antitoxin system RelE/ParE family toxin [Oxalobacter formigenes]